MASARECAGARCMACRVAIARVGQFWAYDWASNRYCDSRSRILAAMVWKA